MNWPLIIGFLIAALGGGVALAMSLPTPVLAGIGTAVVVVAPAIIVALLILCLVGRLLAP